MPLSAAEEARLFAQLADLPAAEREIRLAALALDPDSLARLRRLFDVPAGWDSEIEAAIAAEAESWSSRPLRSPGSTLDRFTLEERLGRGGSGEVYRVSFTQAGVRRQGALKLLHPSLLQSSQAALWDRERRLAAALSHPFIATLLDSGTLSSGQPFLLMEYVEGARIDDYCRNLPLRDRIRILIRVCDAVAAAHHQFVIHRDLKPANILITKDGLPKLVDFGIGQAIESELSAIPAATRSYSSPEQLAGADPTPASDIFSLGRVIATVLGDHPPAELQSLIVQATHPNPALRYETANALRDDLANWLNGRPVQAHSASRGYRWRCFLLRNRWPVAAAAVLLLAAVIASAVAWRQYREATTRFNELRSLARSAIFDFDTAIRDLPSALPARKVLAESALGYLASLEAAARGDRSLRAELADAYQRVAVLHYNTTGASLDRQQTSFELLKKSLALRDELGQNQSRDPLIRRDYAALLSRLTTLSRARMRGEESRLYLERLNQYTTRWRQEEPNNREALESAIFASDETARMLYMQDRQRAYEHQTKAVGEIEKLLEFGPPDRRYWKIAADSYRLFGSLAMGAGHADEGHAHFRRAIAAANAWRAAEPSLAAIRTALLCHSEAVYALLQRSQGPWDEAERLHAAFASILDSPALPDPQAAIWLQHQAERYSLRAHLDAAQRRPAEARRAIERANEILDQALKEETGSFWAPVLRARLAKVLSRLEADSAK